MIEKPDPKFEQKLMLSVTSFLTDFKQITCVLTLFVLKKRYHGNLPVIKTPNTVRSLGAENTEAHGAHSTCL